MLEQITRVLVSPVSEESFMRSSTLTRATMFLTECFANVVGLVLREPKSGAALRLIRAHQHLAPNMPVKPAL